MTMDELKALAWKPIDTAPTDGTVVLLTAIEDDGELFEVWPMQWAHIQQNGLFPGRVGMWTHPSAGMTWNGDADGGGPTHWHPMPDAQPLSGWRH